MKLKNINITYKEIADIAQLSSEDQYLIESAKLALNNSYSPYSQFKVSAAVLLENGTIINGNNQENAAYPSGLCAERVALFWATSQYPGVAIKAIAVVASNSANNSITAKPIIPCGGCLQVMDEYEILHKSTIKIIMHGKDKTWVVEGVNNMLPFSFNRADMLK